MNPIDGPLKPTSLHTLTEEEVSQTKKTHVISSSSNVNNDTIQI